MTTLEKEAKALSCEFIENEGQYRLGFIEAERSNPKTIDLGGTFVRSTEDGLRMLLDVDRDLTELYAKTLWSDAFSEFSDDVYCALIGKKKIYLSGCGSSGRLSMRLEASFREAVRNNPALSEYADSVYEIMTGGDYAIIRAVESAEDYTALGAAQARDAGVGEGDILIGVTATGETTSVLGTAKEALEAGAKVYMVVCSDPDEMLGKLKRADDVYKHENCKSIYLKCGPMALTGSTRMQSSSIEQAVIGSALELALGEISSDGITREERIDSLIRGFSECIELLLSDEGIASMTEQTDKETELYLRGGHVTYFADEYILDVLADTTERGPTFTTPPFRPRSWSNDPISWAFVKKPFLDTAGAWESLFGRLPRCLDKTEAEYRNMGILDEDIKKIPNISIDALYQFEIGREEDPEREGEGSLATWVALAGDAPSEFLEIAKRYEGLSILTLGSKGIKTGTRMKLFSHLAMKMAINAVSTGTMAKMGRIFGNYMVHLNISNKKLIDRATRIISDLCQVDYEKANYELFLSSLILKSRSIERSTTIETVERLGLKIGDGKYDN